MTSTESNRTSIVKPPNRARAINTVLGLLAASLVATLGLGGPSFAQTTLLDGVCSDGDNAPQAPVTVPEPSPVPAPGPLACGDADGTSSP